MCVSAAGEEEEDFSSRKLTAQLGFPKTLPVNGGNTNTPRWEERIHGWELRFEGVLKQVILFCHFTQLCKVIYV
jgi:hypothetical protein